MAMQGFDRARPLWELLIVEGLVDGQAATILKLHHAISDGIGAVQIALSLFDLERDPAPPGAMPDAPEANVLSMPARVADAVDHEGRRLRGIAKRVPETLVRAVAAVASNPVRASRTAATTAGSASRLLALTPRPLSPLLSARSLSVRFDALSLPLEDLKAAGRVAGGRLNDAFVAGAIGGFRRYHDHHGVDVEALRMGLPINVREGDNSDLAGNAFAPVRTIVPTTIDDPVERMRAIRDLVADLRAEPAMALIEPMAVVVHRLPTSLSTAIFQQTLRGQDFVTSNVPGVPIPVFIAGAAIVAQYPFGPLAGAAVNLTLLSYQDQVHVGVNTDPAAIPDPDVLLACLHESFDEIRKVG